MDTMDDLIESNEDLVRKMTTIRDAVSEQVMTHLRNRTLVVTGDTSHFSIQYYIERRFADIDKPKDYEWQKDNCYEEDFAHVLERFLGDPLRVTMAFINQKVKLHEFTSGEAEIIVRGDSDFRCYECRARLMLRIKGNHIHFEAEEGAECGMHRNFTVEVSFPTGEVVFDDWPDRFSEMEEFAKANRETPEMNPFWEARNFDINYMVGERQTSDAMAKLNILHMFVGNSSPTFGYNEETGDIFIGRLEREVYDEEADEYIETPNPDTVGYKKLGSFCTDLWWVTMLDKSVYNELLSYLPPDTRGKDAWRKDVHIAKVRPGRYRFTAHYGMDPVGDPDYCHKYVTAEYLGPCE